MWVRANSFGTILDALELHLSTTLHLNSHPFITNIAQYAQYVLLVTGILWYRRHGREALMRDEPRTAPAIVEAELVHCRFWMTLGSPLSGAAGHR